MDELASIDKALDEALVNLGAMVLRLANPAVTRSTQERRALARSVYQYTVSANRSYDPRVQRLRVALEETIRPKLRLVSGG
jgi:Uri superfamily endonuclease